VPTGTWLAAAIAAEKLDEFGNPVQSSHRHLTQPLKPRAPVKCKQATMDADETDADNENFAASSTVTSHNTPLEMLTNPGHFQCFELIVMP